MTIIDRLKSEKNCIGVRYLSEILGMHYMTVYGWAHDGKIPFIRLGNRIKSDPAVVVTWLEARSS